MSRNLVICCDGTNNQFGTQNTSVVRLVQALDRNPTKQRLFYDPGVGTLPEPGHFTAIGKRISEILGLAIGVGLTDKVENAYTFLMDSLELGDQVYLFGFSRGAYTARVLAGLLHTLGLLPRGGHNLTPYVLRLFGGLRGYHERDDASGFWNLCDEFRRTFSRVAQPGRDDRRFPVRFLGLWDTVSSVGWVWDPVKFPFTTSNPSVSVIRHAVSVDERRAFFRQHLMNPTPGQDLQELWFPGVHSDVGGGYPEADGGLWRIPFEWMISDAEHAGLLVDRARLQTVLNRSPASQTPWNDPQHESLTPLWWPAEFFPKMQWNRKYERRLPTLGLGRPRFIPTGAMMHQSVLLRVRQTAYAPSNFSEAFLQKIRNLGSVPTSLPYER